MNNLIIKSLLIFELGNKLAKKIDFADRVNVITSDKENGNDVGKSIILKSIFHTLGADSRFDDKWNEMKKIYIIKIEVNSFQYFVYRNDKLFKVFDREFNRLFFTNNRKELAAYFENIFNFSVKLPKRDEEKLETAPPAFNYLLNYIDQDHMNGSQFSAFLSLQQYPNFKENVIFNHFGLFNEEYFETKKMLDELKKNKKEIENEKSIVNNMLDRINNYLGGIDPPMNQQGLEIELNHKKEEYRSITSKLRKVKRDLTNYRNKKIDLENSLENLLSLKNSKEEHVSQINKNICPTCDQHTNNISLRISENSELEDFYLLKDEYEMHLLEFDKHIGIEEEKYYSLLTKFQEFENEIEYSSNAMSDVLKHRGYLETKENILNELGSISQKLHLNEEKQKAEMKIINQYKNLKKKANNLYRSYMENSIDKHQLKEIHYDSVKNIRKNLNAGGSNIPLITVIWHFNLLKIKNELNSSSIKFPLVLDSPNNVESDDRKREMLFDFIFNNVPADTQLIVSTLGFERKEFPNVEIDNIVKLNNKKYQLLNEHDYRENAYMLDYTFLD